MIFFEKKINFFLKKYTGPGVQQAVLFRGASE
jgi:hypothetical protein